MQLRQQQLIPITLGDKEVIQQLTQAFAPFTRHGRTGQLRFVAVQRIQQAAERADQRRVQPANLVIGFDLLPRLGTAAGVTQQHPAQAETPAVGFQPVWQTQSGAALLIQPPADACALDPALQGRQVGLTQAKATAQRRHIEQVQHLTDRQPAVRQTQQVLQCNQQRLLAALALISQGKGNRPRVVATVLTKHRLNMRCVEVNVRHHDDDVAWFEVRVGSKGGQQLIVQHFDFALRAVRQVKADGVIPCGVDRRPQVAGLGQRPQLQDVLLQLLQQRVAGRCFKQVNPATGNIGEARFVTGALVVLVEQVDVVTALLAPGGQQRMGVLVQGVLVQLQRRTRPPLLTAVLVAQQVLIGNDIAPVVLTGVEHAEQHLREAADHRQRLQRLRRQRRDTEYDHPPRQAGWPAVTVEQALDKARMDARPAVAQAFGTHVDQHRAPERRLPAFLVIQRPRAGTRQADMVAPGGPVIQPVGAVNLILVEQVGQPHRQLVTLAAIVVIGEKAFKRGEIGLILQCGQQPHQPPGQRLLVERRLLGHAVAPQNAAVAVP